MLYTPGMATIFAIVLTLFVLICLMLDWAVDDERDRALIEAAEAAERERLKARFAKQSVMASQTSLNRMGYAAGEPDGIVGEKTTGAMNAWAKDVWAGIRAPHGSPERNKLNRMAGGV